MPEGAVYVGRPSRWGNPYRLGDFYLGRPMDRRETVQRFSLYARERLAIETDWLEPLRRHDLACFCPLDQPCHADVLAELIS